MKAASKKQLPGPNFFIENYWEEMLGFLLQNKAIIQEFNAPLGQNRGSTKPWLKKICNITVYSLATTLP